MTFNFFQTACEHKKIGRCWICADTQWLEMQERITALEGDAQRLTGEADCHEVEMEGMEAQVAWLREGIKKACKKLFDEFYGLAPGPAVEELEIIHEELSALLDRKEQP